MTRPIFNAQNCFGEVLWICVALPYKIMILNAVVKDITSIIKHSILDFKPFFYISCMLSRSCEEKHE